MKRSEGRATCGEEGRVATTIFSTVSSAPGESGSGVFAPLLASVLHTSGLKGLERKI
jgi:hypothetical protein